MFTRTIGVCPTPGEVFILRKPINLVRRSQLEPDSKFEHPQQFGLKTGHLARYKKCGHLRVLRTLCSLFLDKLFSYMITLLLRIRDASRVSNL